MSLFKKKPRYDPMKTVSQLVADHEQDFNDLKQMNQRTNKELTETRVKLSDAETKNVILRFDKNRHTHLIDELLKHKEDALCKTCVKRRAEYEHWGGRTDKECLDSCPYDIPEKECYNYALLKNVAYDLNKVLQINSDKKKYIIERFKKILCEDFEIEL